MLSLPAALTLVTTKGWWMMILKSKTENKAQSTLEYVIVLAVIIAVIVAVARTVISPAIEASMNNLGNAIVQASDEF